MFSKAKNSPTALLLATLATASPELTAAPAPALAAVSSSTRVTTSFYSLVTTQIPRDEHSIGMGLQREGTDEYYWLYCINDTFTTYSGYAGCGEDDLYTSCSGRVATGIDGEEILCDRQCVTHKVFADLDVTTFTPFIGCGRGTSTMNLLRTSTGTGTRGTTTPTLASSSSSASATAESAGRSLRCGGALFVAVGLVVASQVLV
ncbi:hypothetical protein CPLU01_13328 [Colletotrichum plurivorum]|uniref:WSC domain-containing protein n=1 Tax=Colletotrichum plurivorum TaxID=2175906 RepID=A0A8H6JT59_9PEZI|nr:hypothetical protein CPLU01_13328 [Colletotrichum plurivorum]